MTQYNSVVYDTELFCVLQRPSTLHMCYIGAVQLNGVKMGLCISVVSHVPSTIQ